LSLIIIIRERIKGKIKLTHIPYLSAVNAFRTRHPVVAHELVELAGGNADVHRGFAARKAAPRDRPFDAMLGRRLREAHGAHSRWSRYANLIACLDPAIARPDQS
jgi:hypothetical protein